MSLDLLLPGSVILTLTLPIHKDNVSIQEFVLVLAVSHKDTIGDVVLVALGMFYIFVSL